MQESTTIRRMSARTAAAVLLAVVGMLALGGAWTSAFANDKSNGANQSGPYDSTSVPCNNQGNGNAPCNGTVGNADDKNPPGQQPGGNDNNNGYECDGNKGVGNDGGNPAHSGCTTSSSSSTSTSTTTKTTIRECTNPAGCNGGGGGGGGGNPSTPAGDTPRADVLGLTEEAPGGSAAPAAATAPGATVAGTELAFTGATSDVLGFLAVALLAFGTAFILVARKPEEIAAY